MAAKGKSSSRNKAGKVRFDERLVLNQWMLSLFEVKTFEQLAETLKDPAFEGFEEDNSTKYFQMLKLRLFERENLPVDLLQGYDRNIVRHWREITERRSRTGHPVMLKYFQYLTLLFTEIYLDRYFRNPQGLADSLNRHVDRFNEGMPKAAQVAFYDREGLNKIAFWMATGSGKTLIMHVNILQYRHYLRVHGRERDLGRVILLTPNEGLSRQHLEELGLSVEPD